MKLHTSKMVMATASRNTRAPNSIPAGSSLSNWNIQCHYCQKFGHRYSECRKRLSRGNHLAPSHKAAAVTHTDTSDMSYHDVAPAPQPSTLSPVKIKALIHQVLSKSTLNSAMSTIPGNSFWYIDSAYCNHMTPTYFLQNLFYLGLPPFTLLMVLILMLVTSDLCLIHI
jgi:hypothetical protein